MNITKNAPLRAKEAADLSAIMEVMAKQGVGLKLVLLDATSNGHMLAKLQIVKPIGLRPTQKKAVMDQILALAKATQTWKAAPGRPMCLTSKKLYPHLKDAKAASPGFLKFLGITTRFAYPVNLKHLGGFERMLNNPMNGDVNLKKVEEFILELVSRETPVLRQLLIMGRERFLQKRLDVLVSGGASLALALIMEDTVRDWYKREIKKMSQDFMRRAKSGQLSWLQAEFQAHAARGEIMDNARKAGTTAGRLIVEKIKPKNLTLAEIQAKKLKKLGFTSLTQITAEERIFMAEEIVRNARNSNVSVNISIKTLRILGRGIWILTAVLAAYSVYEAENRVRETGKQVTIIGSGIVGGIAGGKLGFLCGNFAFICVPLGIVIGGILAAWNASEFFDPVLDSISSPNNNGPALDDVMS